MPDTDSSRDSRLLSSFDGAGKKDDQAIKHCLELGDKDAVEEIGKRGGRNPDTMVGRMTGYILWLSESPNKQSKRLSLIRTNTADDLVCD